MSNPITPSIRLDFYEEGIILHKNAGIFQQTQQQLRQSYPIALEELVSALTDVDIRSGWLPKNCLFWNWVGGKEQIGIYVPARRWRVQMAEKSYHIPLPKILFIGDGQRYQIFALKRYPREPSVSLFQFPCPNVHPNGQICAGNAPFPTASAGTMETALQLFLQGSLFNRDLNAGKCKSYPNDVLKLWAELDGKARFSLQELMPAGRLTQ